MKASDNLTLLREIEVMKDINLVCGEKAEAMYIAMQSHQLNLQESLRCKIKITPDEAHFVLATIMLYGKFNVSKLAKDIVYLFFILSPLLRFDVVNRIIAERTLMQILTEMLREKLIYEVTPKQYALLHKGKDTVARFYGELTCQLEELKEIINDF